MMDRTEIDRMMAVAAPTLIAAATGEQLIAIDQDRVVAVREAAAPRGNTDPRAIAVIPVHGVLSPRGYSGFFGSSVGMNGIQAALAAAVANAEVGIIVLAIDSPGGTVAGTPETAAAVRSAAASKKVVAVADTLAASAAYWIGSQASEFVVAPSADIGSIGVVGVHNDLSKLYEQWGIKTTLIHAGKFKVEGNPFEPLSDEARANMQARVDEAHGQFIRDVALGRGTTQANVRENFGQGRTIGSRKAVDLGMADRIATLGEVIAGLSAKSPARRRSALLFD